MASKIRAALTKNTKPPKATFGSGNAGGIFNPSPVGKITPAKGFAPPPPPKPIVTQAQPAPPKSGSGIGTAEVTPPPPSTPPTTTYETDPAYQTSLAGLAQGERNLVSGSNDAIVQGLQGFGLDDNQEFDGFAFAKRDEYGRVQMHNGQPMYDPVKLQALAANPFSRAQMLKQSLQTANKTSINSYAGGGQLYSGALRRQAGADGSDYAAKGAMDRPDILEGEGVHSETAGGSALLGGRNQQNFLGALDALIRDRNQHLAGVRGGYQSGMSGILSGEASAAGSALERWLLAQANSDTPYAGPDTTPGPSPAVGGAEYQPGSGRPTTANVPTIKGTDIPKSTLPTTASPFKDRPKKPAAKKGHVVEWNGSRWVQVKKGFGHQEFVPKGFAYENGKGKK